MAAIAVCNQTTFREICSAHWSRGNGGLDAAVERQRDVLKHTNRFPGPGRGKGHDARRPNTEERQMKAHRFCDYNVINAAKERQKDVNELRKKAKEMARAQDPE